MSPGPDGWLRLILPGDLLLPGGHHQPGDQVQATLLVGLDSFTAIGSCLGLPLGTYISNNHGFTAVFCVGGAAIIVAILYVVFMFKTPKRKKIFIVN